MWDVSGPNVTQSGEWRMDGRGGYSTWRENHPVTSEAGAAISIALPPQSAWVQLGGYASGSYAVRCVPTPPNTTDTTYLGYHPNESVVLYAAQLDAAYNYTLELTNLNGTTGLRSLVTRQYKPPPPDTSALRTGLGVGLGFGVPLLACIAACTFISYRWVNLRCVLIPGKGAGSRRIPTNGRQPLSSSA